MQRVFTYQIRANKNYQESLCFIPNDVKDKENYICTPEYIKYLEHPTDGSDGLKNYLQVDGKKKSHTEATYQEKKKSAEVRNAIDCEFLYTTFVTELAWF